MIQMPPRAIQSPNSHYDRCNAWENKIGTLANCEYLNLKKKAPLPSPPLKVLCSHNEGFSVFLIVCCKRHLCWLRITI
jgi:hypothetical protein